MKNLRFAARLQKIREQLDRQQLDAVQLTLQKNISWLIGGRSHVNIASEPACCQFIVSRTHCVFISNNIESVRLLEEEISLSDDQAHLTAIEVWPWYEPARLGELTEQYLREFGAWKTDSASEAWLLPLRSILDEHDAQKMRQIGALTAEAIEQAAIDIQSGDSEYAIAGKLANACWSRELDPIVNLVAVDERTWTRRHPQPTGRRLENSAMLVVCARRDGLIASATRMVHFGAVPDTLKQRHEAVARIDAKIMHETRPGVTLGSLYALLREFYEHEGYAGEMTSHHQGGLTGYATRERLALPGSDLTVCAGQAYAWNPSIAGVKSEDTILVSENGNEVVTQARNFPEIQIRLGDKLWTRPGILVQRK